MTTKEERAVDSVSVVKMGDLPAVLPANISPINPEQCQLQLARWVATYNIRSGK